MVQTVVQPDNVVRIVWEFVLGPDPVTQNEIAQFGINGLASPGPLTEPDWVQYLKDLAFAAGTAWSGQMDAGQFSGNVHLPSVKAVRYDTLGRTKTEEVWVSGEVWQGSDPDTHMPWQCSVCVGLYTYTPGSFIADARSRRGRVFLPVPGPSVMAGGTGLMTAAATLEFATRSKSMIIETQLINGSANPAWRWNAGVLSKGPFKDGRLVGDFNVLTDIACDSKIDTQRRRVNRLVGVRQSVPFA